MSITKLSPNWACQMGPIQCPKFLLPGAGPWKVRLIERTVQLAGGCYGTSIVARCLCMEHMHDKGDLIEGLVPHSRLVTIRVFWIAVYYVGRFSKDIG